MPIHWLTLLSRKHCPPIRFLLLMPGRTGSSFLVEKLNDHPNMIAEIEPFRRFENNRPVAADKRNRDVRNFMRRFFGTKYSQQIQAVGFKTKLSSSGDPIIFDLEAFRREIVRASVNRLIMMLRRNLAKQAISRIRADLLKEHRLEIGKTKAANVYHTNDCLPATKIDPRQILKFIKLYEIEQKRITSFAQTLRSPSVMLHYEDLSRDTESVMTQVCDFLETDYRETRSQMVKHTSDDLSKVITNFSEVAEFFRDTEYESQLFEGVGDTGHLHNQVA